MTTAVAAARRCCCVCERFGVVPGETWCRRCVAGYALSRQALQSFRPSRPPDPAIIRENIRRYRRCASLGLPIFGGPPAAGSRAEASED
jgi:hypothetical protein